MADWHEYIKDHIEHQLWQGGKLDKAVAEVSEAVKTHVLESDEIIDLIHRSATSCDCHTLGHDMKLLFEKELAEYCERNDQELTDQFPEQWEDFKEQDSGDIVDV